MRHVFVVLSLLAATEAAGQEPPQVDEAELPKVRRFAAQLGAAYGARWADGSMLSTPGNPAYASETLHPIEPGFSFVLDYAFNRHLGAQVGVSYVTKGSTWFCDIYAYRDVEVRLQYLTLPLMLRFELPLEGKLGVLRPYVRGGIAGDLVLWKGGFWVEDGITRDLARETTFYNGHHSYNLSFLWGLGLEAGIFENPSFLVGVDMLFENDLLGEFDSSAWGGANWQYGNAYFGVHLTYQTYAAGP